MRPITVTVGNLAVAGNATLVRTASTVAAGNVVLNGVTNAGAGTDRNILFTFASAEPGLRLEIAGQNALGRTVSETILGPAAPGTVLTVNQYNKISYATSNQASAGNVSIGTSSIGTTPWVAIDDFAPSSVSVQCNVSGTVNYTVQSTLDDPTDPTSPLYNNVQGVTWVASSDTAAVGATATIQTNFLFAPQFVRVLLNSGTGLVTATVLQSGSS